jgi:NhaP-type Na+/H+ or K+/H+ antiporter
MGEAGRKGMDYLGWAAATPWSKVETLLGLLLLVVLMTYAFRRIWTILLTWRAQAFAPTISRRLSNWVRTVPAASK